MNDKPKRKTSRITIALLVIALIAMISLSVYYYSAVYLPAQGQAQQIRDAGNN